MSGRAERCGDWGRGGDRRAATGVGAGTGRLGVGARRGPASGDRRAGDQVRTGEPDAGSGGPAVRPAGTGERGAASRGGVCACPLVSFEMRV